MPPRRKGARGRGRKKTQQSTPSAGEGTPQTVRQEPAASTSRGLGHANIALKASTGQPAPDGQATPSSPPEQSRAYRSDGEHREMPAPELPLKRKRGQPPKTNKVAPKQSKVGASGSSSNPPAASPNEETKAAPPPADSSQLETAEAGSAEPPMRVVDRSTMSSGAKGMEGRYITRSLSKSMEEPDVERSTASEGVRASGRARKVQRTPSGVAADGLSTKKRAIRRGSPPGTQREAVVTTAPHSSPRRDFSQAQNIPTNSISVMAPGPSGQRVSRALSKSRTEKAPTNEHAEEIHRNVRTGGSGSDQQGLSSGVVTKAPRVHQQGKEVDAPEGHTNETSENHFALASEDGKTPPAMRSPASPGPKAIPSSSRLSSRRRLFEKDAIRSSTLEKGARNVQVNAHTSKHQHMSDDAARPGQVSQGDAETSSPAREKGSTGKKNVQAVPQGVSKTKVSARPPLERRRFKRLSAETSRAEAGPSGVETTRTQQSLREGPHSLGITASNREHASGSSRSRSLRSRRQADGAGNAPQTEHVPESGAGTANRAPQRHPEREKLRARPRHLWKRRTAQEPVFIVEDREPSRRAPSPNSRDKTDATLSLSPVPSPVASLSDDGYAGKLGFHWYEATFGVLRRGRADAAEREESDDDDDDIESLHWNSDTEERVSENDSSDVDSGDDLLDLPWDGDSRSVQLSEDLEPGVKVQRLDRWQKVTRQRVRAYLPGVQVTNRAWDTIDKWHNHFLENMGQSVQAMAERAGHDRIEEEDVVWFIHRYLGTADPFKLWALADELLPAELRNQIYPATPCALASKDA